MTRPLYRYNEEWEKSNLEEVLNGDVIVGVSSGSTPSTKIPKYWGGTIEWATPKEVTNGKVGRFIKMTERTITQDGLNASGCIKLPVDTVMLTKRAPVGEVVMNKVVMTTNQGFLNFRCGKKLLPDFLYYWFKANKPYIEAIANGSTYLELYQSDLFELEIALPKIPEQKLIVKILEKLDKKIEHLKLTNKILEKICESIFKSWFVDFENFSNLSENQSKELPKGWSMSTIDKETKAISGGTPLTVNKSYWENGTVAWISSSKAREFRVIEPTAYISQRAKDDSTTKSIPKNTTIIAITGSTMGQISFTEIDCCVSQNIVGVIENAQISSEFIYFWIKHKLSELLSWQTGGAQQHINKGVVENLPLLLPPPEVLEDFKQISRPLFKKIGHNAFQVASLIKIKNLLLPKLISGKIRIENFEKFSEPICD